MKVQITDVYLRDGLQDEDVIVATEDKLAVADALVAAGIDRIEAGSFVNPRRVPQMGDAAEVLSSVTARHPSITWTCLALNGKGIDRAVAAGAEHIQIVASASQAHSSANAGSSIEDAMAGLAQEVRRHPEVQFFAGISTAFTCPFEGTIDQDHLTRIVRAFREMGVTEVGLADTLGTTPTEQVIATTRHVMAAEPGLTLSLHLHNAKGQALDTVTAAVEELGITRFDSALSGFGGCPFAPGAHGNIATEQLVTHLHQRGHDTGIDEARLQKAVELGRAVVASAAALPNQDPVAG